MVSVMQDIFSGVCSAASDAQLSVFGLPVASGQADGLNQHYSDVLSSCSAIVSSRAIIVAGSDDNEARALRRSLPNALSLASGRDIFFRCNGEWRQAVIDDSPGAADTYPASEITRTKSSASNGSNSPFTAQDIPGGGTNEGIGEPRGSAPAAPAAAGSTGGSGAPDLHS